MSLESARGRAKNARNELRSILAHVRHEEIPDEQSVEYALDEVLAALDEIEEASND